MGARLDTSLAPTVGGRDLAEWLLDDRVEEPQAYFNRLAWDIDGRQLSTQWHTQRFVHGPEVERLVAAPVGALCLMARDRLRQSQPIPLALAQRLSAAIDAGEGTVDVMLGSKDGRLALRVAPEIPVSAWGRVLRWAANMFFALQIEIAQRIQAGP